MTYQIKLEQFEGPLDVLLGLIEEQKLDVTRVSLAAVADQYLDYLNRHEAIPLENLAEFLRLASRLILIKSKALLPVLETTDEEEREILDLEFQLQEYRKFKTASQRLGALFHSPLSAFSRPGFWGIRQFFLPPPGISGAQLAEAFVGILGEIPILRQLEEEMIQEVMTLEDKITELQATLQKRLTTSFSEIASRTADRAEIIVSFLAILELVKQRIIHVEQSKLFGDIQLRHASA